MQISIGNAPCSWGVEFADDPRNPHWAKVLDETKEAGTPASSLAQWASCPRIRKF